MPTASPARPASTVALLRERPGTPPTLETYLLARPPRGTFPGAHVFPGGGVDAGDKDAAWATRTMGADKLIRRLSAHLPAGEALAHGIAAAREVFEETGLLLARSHALPDTAVVEARDTQLATRTGFGDWCSQHDLQISLEVLLPWAHWITPESEQARFDTWIFLALAPKDQLTSTVTGELLGGRWIAVDQALKAVEQGEILLLPPTLRTLQELADLGAWPDLVRAAEERPLTAIMPRRLEGAEVPTLLLPGDPAFGEPAALGVEGPTRFVFRDSRWWSEAAPHDRDGTKHA